MIIYTLTETLTQESFSPKQVFTFVSHEQAHKQMIQQIYDYLKKCGDEIPMEELDAPNGYEDGSLCIGYDYARDDAGVSLWEIFKTEVSMREVIIGNIMGYIRETYKTPERFNDVLYNLINEYKDSDLNAIASEGDFVQEHVIGEALYQNALAQLGGKTDEVSYGKILEYLNESEQFIDVRCTLFNYWDLPVEEEKLEKWQRWFIGMLTICDGNSTMINLVREDIDDRQPEGEKIFVIERKHSIVAEHKNELPQNHRDLCSKLSDDQYFEIMANILTYKFKFGSAATFHDQMVHIYDEMKYVVFKVIKNYGVDAIYQNYGNIDIEDDKENGWNIVFVGEPCDIAHMIDELKNQYDNLF
jgi:hypothetical protein